MTLPQLSEGDDLTAFLDHVHFVLPNFNDTFAYACADTEQLSVGDGEHLARFWRQYGWHGLVAIAAYKRKRDPLRPVAEHPNYIAALADLRSDAVVDEEDWTLADEFELR